MRDWATNLGRAAKGATDEITLLKRQRDELREALKVAIGRFKLIQADGTTPRMRQVIAGQGEQEALANLNKTDGE